MTSTTQQITETLYEKYEVTVRSVQEASYRSIEAYERIRTATNDEERRKAEREVQHQREYLQGVMATAKGHSLVYDDKLEYLYQKLKYETTGDEEYGEIVRMKEACRAFTTKYSPTIQEILHHANLHKNLVEFYSESPLFWYNDDSIVISRNCLSMHYNKLVLLFSFDSPDIDQFIYHMYRIALRIRAQHIVPAITEFIQRCREKYVIPLTIRRAERYSNVFKTTTPLVDDTICEIVSFVQTIVNRRRIDEIIYGS